MPENTFICNPIDLPYRYQDFGRGPFRAVFRESADPSIVRFRDRFFLFGSMSGGFFHSEDLASWEFVRVPELPVGDYAPDVREIDGALVVTASRRAGSCPILRSRDPLLEPFTVVAQSGFAHYDPNVFEDHDGRRYLYWGCSNHEPVRGVEMDADFQPIGEQVDLITGAPQVRGWERPGESNVVPQPSTLKEKLSARLFGTHSQTPYIEGPWMTAHRGTYYLQYAAPGTEYNVYADGYYTGPTPLGPFEYSPASPFSSKPGGFITGAGHGSTFQDAHGNWWHAATMRISVNHHFERRIGLFPAGFDDEGVLFCNQEFGDYPLRLADGPVDPWTGFSTGWMLQSYGASATASSSAVGHEPGLATDEDVRTWWAAGSAGTSEVLTLDLTSVRTVHAIQVNLADHDLTSYKPRRPLHDPEEAPGAFRSVTTEDRPAVYVLEVSPDGEHWTTVFDGRETPTDAPHRLVRLDAGTPTRFVRLTGLSTPWGSPFAVSGLRAFGTDDREAPHEVVPDVARTNALEALVSWPHDESRDGVIVRYGAHPDRLYHSWQVWGEDRLVLPTLNEGCAYFVAIDAYNAGGVTRGPAVPVPSPPS